MKKGVTPMSDPSGTLFYLDYKYGDESSKSHKKTRRSKKKKSNVNLFSTQLVLAYLACII
jgi:hypothetical protein